MSFSTLLVANRGEIARRILRAARESGLRGAAVYVAEDEDAPFVHDADVACRLSTGYLDVDALIAAAHLMNAEAIHPGYGFLSENAAFAQRVIDEHLVWVGPPPEVIAAAGDKLVAKRLARELGVATLPSSEDPNDAATIGFPLMIKAAGGGGGKGMRVVEESSQLGDALAAARREALAGFGDERVFLERYVARARHVEIQILGDVEGHLVHLGERDCSIQRRHQKLIEESPSPVMDDGLRQAMGDAALTLARAMHYSSAGTVEFLVDDVTHDFFFLEVNARLQVEHPVSEAVTGIDVVREQLRLASGAPLGYEQSDVVTRGSAIEVRLCAEDPSTGFLPATGTIAAFEPSATPVVRWESGVGVGSRVGVAFDPLLAKVIAHAPTRAAAASTLASALERLHLGGVKTNRDFLAATLRDEHFLAGDTTTDFIERVRPRLDFTPDDAERRFLLVAAALWLQAGHRRRALVWSTLPSGWRNARLPDEHVTFRYHGEAVAVTYRTRRDGTFDVGSDGPAVVHSASDDVIDLELGERRARTRITQSLEHLYVQASRGTIDFEIVARFLAPQPKEEPGGLHAPMPGLVLDVRVAAGQRVTKGETVVVLEAMKMEHVVSAPASGVVRAVLVEVGAQVASGVELLALDLDDESAEVSS